MVSQTLAIGIRLVLLLTLLGGIAPVAPTVVQTPAAAKNERNGQVERNGQDERNGQYEQDERNQQDEKAEQDEEAEQDEPSADVGATAAAAAPQTVYTDPADGSARLQDYGDHVLLCDHDEDNHGVGVYIEYTHENGRRITEPYWYGDGPYKNNGCRDINLKIKEWTAVTLKVCLADHTKRDGKKPKVVSGTCQSDAWINNG